MCRASAPQPAKANRNWPDGKMQEPDLEFPRGYWRTGRAQDDFEAPSRNFRISFSDFFQALLRDTSFRPGVTPSNVIPSHRNSIASCRSRGRGTAAPSFATSCRLPVTFTSYLPAGRSHRPQTGRPWRRRTLRQDLHVVLAARVAPLEHGTLVGDFGAVGGNGEERPPSNPPGACSSGGPRAARPSGWPG